MSDLPPALQDRPDHFGTHPERYILEDCPHPGRDRALAPDFPQFDWEGLYRLLGESEALPESEWEKLSHALAEIFAWIVLRADAQGRPHQRTFAQIARRGAVALSWVLHSDWWDGKSAAQVARFLGCNVDLLHRETADARRRWGIKNHSQDHASNFKK